jgi:hypothetical protein
VQGSLLIELLKGDYSEVLTVDGASFISEGNFEIPWLRWLTLEGDKIMVGDHSFVGGYLERSRTGYGIMAKPGNWHVPVEYAGTAEENWITRALAGLPLLVENIIKKEI